MKQSFIRSIWDEIEDQQETETSPEFVKKHLKHDPDKDTEVSAPPFKDQKRKRNYPPIKIEDEKTKENENEEDDYWVYDPKRSASYRGGGGLFSTKRSFDRIFEEMIREILGDGTNSFMKLKSLSSLSLPILFIKNESINSHFCFVSFLNR